MIDHDHGVKLIIRIYSKQTEELLGEIDLSSFALSAFQVEFCRGETENPMFDCFQVEPEQVAFVEQYIDPPAEWDFQSNFYFIEADCV